MSFGQPTVHQRQLVNAWKSDSLPMTQLANWHVTNDSWSMLEKSDSWPMTKLANTTVYSWNGPTWQWTDRRNGWTWPRLGRLLRRWTRTWTPPLYCVPTSRTETVIQILTTNPGADVKNKCLCNIASRLCWNKVVWLVRNSRGTWNSQSEWYAILKIVFDIGSCSGDTLSLRYLWQNITIDEI